MAVFNVNWILFASALVGCALIAMGTSVEVESNQLDNTQSSSEELMSMLEDQNLKPKELDEMLRAPKYKDVKISEYKIGLLPELCEESLKNCSPGMFKLISSVTSNFKRTIPQLYSYGQYCRHEKLKKYCLDNIEQVAKNFVNDVKIDDRARVNHFVQFLGKSDIVDRAHRVDVVLQLYQEAANKIGDVEAVNGDSSITAKPYVDEKTAEAYKRNQARSTTFDKLASKDTKESFRINRDISDAYSDFLRARVGSKIPLYDQEIFLYQIMRILENYAEMYSFLREICNEDERGPEPNNERAFELFRIGRVAHRFYFTASKEIIYKLEQKIAKKVGKKYTLDWDQFSALTLDQLRKAHWSRQE